MYSDISGKNFTASPVKSNRGDAGVKPAYLPVNAIVEILTAPDILFKLYELVPDDNPVFSGNAYRYGRQALPVFKFLLTFNTQILKITSWMYETSYFLPQPTMEVQHQFRRELKFSWI